MGRRTYIKRGATNWNYTVITNRVLNENKYKYRPENDEVVWSVPFPDHVFRVPIGGVGFRRARGTGGIIRIAHTNLVTCKNTECVGGPG